MYHTNASYDNDSDSISHDDLPSNKQHELSPENLRQTSDQSVSAQNLNLNNSARIMINEKHENDVSSEQKVPKMENIHGISFEGDSYYSLKHLSDRRRGKRDEDSSLSRSVKQFYKDQDELIDLYERVYSQRQEGVEGSNTEEKQKYENTQRMSNILTKVSLVANIVRIIHYLIIKIKIIYYSSVYSY